MGQLTAGERQQFDEQARRSWDDVVVGPALFDLMADDALLNMLESWSERIHHFQRATAKA